MAARDFILYPLAGAVVGVGLAYAIAKGGVPLPTFDAATGVFLLAGVILAGAAVVGMKYLRRPAIPQRKTQPAPATGATARIAAGPAPTVAIRLPQIAPGYPDVWSVGEELEVVVDAPADAAVALAAGGKQVGSARSLGSPLAFPLTIAQTGSAALDVVVALDGRKAAARRTVRFVRYDEEIQTLFASFREWAVENWPESKDALTAREMMTFLRRNLGVSDSDALQEATRVFELVAYGGRAADRTLYLQVVDALASVAAAAEAAAPDPSGGVAAGA